MTATETPHGRPRTSSERPILVMIPAFNEQEALPGVLCELAAVAPDAQILVVDDGSVDATSAIAHRAGVEVLTLPFNLGVGGALRAGFRFAQRYGFTRMVQVDADGQHNPAQLPALTAPLDAADLVIGARFAGAGGYRVGFVRRSVMGLLARTLSRRTGASLTDATSGFRAFGPRAIAVFAREYPAEYLGDTVEALLIAARAQLTIVEVPIVMRPRSGGVPSHSAISSALLLARTVPAFVFSSRSKPTTDRGGYR